MGNNPFHLTSQHHSSHNSSCRRGAPRLFSYSLCSFLQRSLLYPDIYIYSVSPPPVVPPFTFPQPPNLPPSVLLKPLNHCVDLFRLQLKWNWSRGSQGKMKEWSGGGDLFFGIEGHLDFLSCQQKGARLGHKRRPLLLSIQRLLAYCLSTLSAGLHNAHHISRQRDSSGNICGLGYDFTKDSPTSAWLTF